MATFVTNASYFEFPTAFATHDRRGHGVEVGPRHVAGQHWSEWPESAQVFHEERFTSQPPASAHHMTDMSGYVASRMPTRSRDAFAPQPTAAATATSSVAGNMDKYKTRLCENWIATNGQFCPFSTKCWFAHGLAELRARPVPVATEPSAMEVARAKRLHRMQLLASYTADGGHFTPYNMEYEHGVHSPSTPDVTFEEQHWAVPNATQHHSYTHAPAFPPSRRHSSISSTDEDMFVQQQQQQLLAWRVKADMQPHHHVATSFVQSQRQSMEPVPATSTFMREPALPYNTRAQPFVPTNSGGSPPVMEDSNPYFAGAVPHKFADFPFGGEEMLMRAVVDCKSAPHSKLVHTESAPDSPFASCMKRDATIRRPATAIALPSFPHAFNAPPHAASSFMDENPQAGASHFLPVALLD